MSSPPLKRFCTENILENNLKEDFYDFLKDQIQHEMIQAQKSRSNSGVSVYMSPYLFEIVFGSLFNKHKPKNCRCKKRNCSFYLLHPEDLNQILGNDWWTYQVHTTGSTTDIAGTYEVVGEVKITIWKEKYGFIVINFNCSLFNTNGKRIHG